MHVGPGHGLGPGTVLTLLLGERSLTNAHPLTFTGACTMPQTARSEEVEAASSPLAKGLRPLDINYLRVFTCIGIECDKLALTLSSCSPTTTPRSQHAFSRKREAARFGSKGTPGAGKRPGHWGGLRPACALCLLAGLAHWTCPGGRDRPHGVLAGNGRGLF